MGYRTPSREPTKRWMKDNLKLTDEEIERIWEETEAPKPDWDNHVAPLVRGLELDAAARWDQFSGVGSSINPKFGLTYSPFRVFTLRGTYGSTAPPA